MPQQNPFSFQAILDFVKSRLSVSGSSPATPPHRSQHETQMPEPNQPAPSASQLAAESFTSIKTFWNMNGSYVGYRASDGLFHMDGHQIGYFAEGDEVYGPNGEYLGEVRGNDRLITNTSKKHWVRKAWESRTLKRSVGQRDVKPMDLLPGFDNFPLPATSR